MQLQSLAHPAKYKVCMITKARVATDERGFTSEVFEAGQDVEVPLQVGHALVRDKMAEWVGKKPPALHDANGLLAEQMRKRAAFSGFHLTRVENAAVHFTHDFYYDGKRESHDFVALFVPARFWEEPPRQEFMNPDHVLSWEPVSRMILSEYVKNPTSQLVIDRTIQVFLSALNGGDRSCLHLSFHKSEKNIAHKVHVGAGFGGSVFFGLQDAEVYDMAMKFNSRVGDFVESYGSGCIPAWIDELLTWWQKHP